MILIGVLTSSWRRMRMGKRSGVMVVVLLLMAFIPAGNVGAQGAPWEEGSVWGYKWQMTFADMVNTIKDMAGSNDSISVKTLRGGMSFMYYVKYVGEDQYGYRFDYKGGAYVKGEVDIEIAEDDGAKVSFYLNVERFETDFSGSFWLVYVYDEGTYFWEQEKREYYGIARHVGEVSGTLKFETKTHSTGNASSSLPPVQLNVKSETNINKLSLTLTFTRPVPYIPLNDTDDADVDTQINYTGHIKADVHTYMSGKISGNTSESALSMSYEYGPVSFDNDFRGTADIYAYLDTAKSGSLVWHPDPIFGLLNAVGMFNLGPLFMSMPTSSDEYAFYWDGYSVPIPSVYEDGFYTAHVSEFPNIYTAAALSASKKNIETEETFYTEPATEDEVNEYIQNKEAYTPGLEFDLIQFLQDNALFIALGVAAVVGTAGVWVFRRRGKSAGTAESKEEAKEE